MIDPQDYIKLSELYEQFVQDWLDEGLPPDAAKIYAVKDIEDYTNCDKFDGETFHYFLTKIYQKIGGRDQVERYPFRCDPPQPVQKSNLHRFVIDMSEEDGY